MNIWERMLGYKHSNKIVGIIFFGTFIPGWILVFTKPYETIGAYLLIPCLVIIIFTWLPPVSKILNREQPKTDQVK